MSNIDYNDPVVIEIVKARVALIFEKAWFGNMATRLILVDASSWCKTAATDGKHLFFNREFIKSLDAKNGELKFLIAHEVLHVCLDHLGRRGGREPKLWNMANDYIINWILVQEKCGSMPKMGLLDNKYTDAWTSEEVYNDLVKNKVTIKMTLDEHLELGNDNEDGGNSSGGATVEVDVIGRDGPPKLSEADLDQIRNETRAAMIQAAQSVGADKIPAGIRRMIDDLITPKLDWRSLLDAHVRSSIKDDFTYTRMSRRTAAMRAAADDYFQNLPVPIMPGQDNLYVVKLVVAVDTSGSMTEDMLRDFLSETKGICQTFRDFEIMLFTFDTEVYNPMVFTPSNIDEIDHYPMAGGGGTMFEVCWDYMKNEGIEPERFVMFTDGYPCGTWGDPYYCDTLFVVHGDTSRVAPFGVTAVYEPK